VIILNVRGTVIGAVVDAVSDVVEIGADGVKDRPTLWSDLNTDHINGMATVDDRMLIMRDMARFLTDEDLVAAKAPPSRNRHGKALHGLSLIGDRQR
jgi:purine-binding chemotaxis protein CheW